MFSSNTPQVAGASSDPQFNYVTMLLPGNGTNGAQNNTFLDSSTNNFTITRNGNTTQGTFTPYGPNWSNYFDGSGDFLTTSNATAFSLGSGDFTFEAWVNFNANTDGNGDILLSIGDGVSNRPLSIYRDPTRIFVDLSTGGTNLTSITFNTTFSAGSWNHVAVVRYSNTIYCYINGVSVGTPTAYSSTLASYTSTVYVGRVPWNSAADMVGYISNLRLVKGAAVYTGNFTPSTTPLTAIANTSLLTCQSNRLIDNSANNLTITANGDVSVQRFSPFSPTAAYSAATISGSGYFDGTGDYLTLPANTNTTLGTGDFTIECWLYGLGSGNYRRAFWFQINNSNSNSGLSVERYTDNGGSVLYTLNFSGGQIQGPNNLGGGVYGWNHIAVTRSSGTTRFYVNGVLGGSASDTANYTTGTAPMVGNAYEFGTLRTDAWRGFISDFRLVKGTALYTGSTFTVPTAPVSSVSGTSILLNFTNGGVIDNAMMNDLETVSNAQISTAQSKFGGGSMLFNGTTDSLLGPSNPSMAFGTGDFTVEGWFYQTADNTYPSVLEIGNHLTANGIIFITRNGGFAIAYANGFIYGPATTLNAWNHIAWVRSSGTMKIYVNGVGGSGTSVTNNLSDSSFVVVGSTKSTTPTNYFYSGYIDDLRVTKGVARYTADFTPPAAPFPTN